MDEKILVDSDLARYGKSYVSEKIEEVYTKMVRQSIDATIGVIDEYIKYWSNKNVQEFHYDVSPVEVLKELRKTMVTGEYSEEMIETLKVIYDDEEKV